MAKQRYTFPCIFFKNKIFVAGGRSYGNDYVALMRECEYFDYEDN